MSTTDISFDEFATLPHAISLLGMSGVGKTMLSKNLRSNDNWFHYSADYRIGTRYLAEHILDNIKFRIMTMGDAFVANLLRSDSIYISHNISVDNLDPVSTFLGLYGDETLGGLNKTDFLERQELYRWAEVESMKDASRFIEKAWRIYQCDNFINDASGSLCEIVDPNNADDPVIEALRAETLILYIKPDTEYENALLRRAREQPKPLFYHPDFIAPKLATQPENGHGVDPVDFAMPLFPELVAFRKPRYEKIAELYGYTIAARELFAVADNGGSVPGANDLLRSLYDVATAAAAKSDTARTNLAKYLHACEKRRDVRHHV
ncbi:MAG: ATPase [Rhodospirillales bacterium]|jgi:hypothetical protein|nr:ATPase [Rhodospirillales bacterium]MBT4040554.1 ATPase [Rhodospirillales bacterium]MBT4626999.1 ATPase [Rhodospirillales bacterium]MBT5352242.1 ATPase [Rhodospirillales bacterium]MBT5522097.1 ATPase [Rhodospirillales bacterium]